MQRGEVLGVDAATFLQSGARIATPVTAAQSHRLTRVHNSLVFILDELHRLPQEEGEMMAGRLAKVVRWGAAEIDGVLGDVSGLRPFGLADPEPSEQPSTSLGNVQANLAALVGYLGGMVFVETDDVLVEELRRPEREMGICSLFDIQRVAQEIVRGPSGSNSSDPA